VVDNLYQFSRADQQLDIGFEVTVRWTADGYSYCGHARITALKRSSVQVCLLQKVGPNGRYPAGTSMELPRFCDQTRWSPRNCVETIVPRGQRL